MTDGWDWELGGSAQDTFERLDEHQQDRIVSKLDEIVADEWRTPDEYLEPLTGSPYAKLRIGSFRLACSARQDEQLLRVYSIEHRSGAYTADDG
jgi:mRNA interferase RelE/StbE